MFFLTQIDPRAAIKGSRDPLGFQPIWTSFGRQVVGNLTSVTRSVKNFATLLLGLYFADQAVSSGRFDEESRADLFMKFEQLAAYSRYAHSEDDGESSEDPLGIRRVKRRLSHKIEPLQGSVSVQYVRCGRSNCKCRKGELHGPY